MATPRSGRPSAYIHPSEAGVTFKLQNVPPCDAARAWHAEVRNGRGLLMLRYPVTYTYKNQVHVRVDAQIEQLSPDVYDIVLLDAHCRECGTVAFDTMKFAAREAWSVPYSPEAMLPEAPDCVGGVYNALIGVCIRTTCPVNLGSRVLFVENAPALGMLPEIADMRIFDGVTTQLVEAIEVSRGRIALKRPAANRTPIVAGAKVEFLWTKANIGRAKVNG